MTDSLDYIRDNFLTIGELVAESGSTEPVLRGLQEAGCLPGPAYRILTNHKILSAIAEHEAQSEEEYYPQVYCTLIREILSAGTDLSQTAKQQRAAFDAQYRAVLLEYDAGKYGMSGYFQQDGRTDDKAIEQLLDQEWQHYLDGTYGLCTKSATARDIALKEVMIARIQFLLDKNASTLLSPEEHNLLMEAVSLYDQVAAAFAPHEYENSSRSKYVDHVRKHYSGDDRQKEWAGS